MDITKLNILGASISVFILAVCSLIFIFRLFGLDTVEYWFGIVFILTAIPLIYLLYTANQIKRPAIYYIQLGFMIAFIIIELLLDYIFKIDFRNIKWMTITYAVLFFTATGGMIGIASHAGKIWTIAAIILFWIMTILTFVQRTKTGM